MISVRHFYQGTTQKKDISRYVCMCSFPSREPLSLTASSERHCSLILLNHAKLIGALEYTGYMIYRHRQLIMGLRESRLQRGKLPLFHVLLLLLFFSWEERGTCFTPSIQKGTQYKTINILLILYLFRKEKRFEYFTRLVLFW